MGDVGMAIQRAEDKTAQMQARAGAIDELMASGALDDVGGRRDDIQAELDQLSANSDVETELRRLRGEIAASAPKQLEVGPNGDGQVANGVQGQSQAHPGPYAPPAPTQNPQQPQNPQQSAGIPVSDLPSANDQPQDGEGP
jgi:phage shock protein A